MIVTNNLKDFPPQVLSDLDIVALSPDDFLLEVFEEKQEQLRTILMQQSEDLRNPHLTVFEILDRLELEAPRFAARMRELF